MELLNIIGLAVLFPLLGALINGFFGHKMAKPAVYATACGSVLLSFLVGLASLFIFNTASGIVDDRFVSTLFTWAAAGDLKIDFAFLVDPLSLVMVLIVAGVSFLIHVYSIGYMAHDRDFARFFTYLNLFVGMMLILVLGASLPIMFIGWEGVGLCSYLLIGFWYHKASANIAGMKAFVVNRIGDFGVLVAMFLLFANDRIATLDFAALSRAIQIYAQTNFNDIFLIAVALFLFLGVTGKSAQIPLYVWLPDAMEGPTPVSALIHAATMVTSGVYLLARMNVLFFSAPTAMLVVAIVGCLTAFVAATIAFSQVDIKRVLAYSTVSQLGYMVLACGVGAFWVGIFHLMTHAFFKALLFLGSGSVIHGMSEEQDIRQMGGLAKKMPTTYWTFLIASMAIAGVPFLSGFFSKDEILAMTYFSEGPVPIGKWLFAVALLTAFMTAFYMFRLVIRTFLGEPQSEKAKHAHESPRVMTVPLTILAVLSVIGGYIGLPAIIGEPLHVPNVLEHFLAPAAQTFEYSPDAIGESGIHAAAEIVETHSGAVESRGAAAGESHATENEVHSGGHDPGTAWLLLFASVAAGGLGIWFAFLYFRAIDWSKLPALRRGFERFGFIAYGSIRKWFVDEIYQYAIVEPGKILANIAWVFDMVVVDGIVNGTAGFFAFCGERIRSLQTGVVRAYAAALFIGTVGLLAIIIISRLVL
ncbi:MAG: NADH-quinone oxidoreductase subunit L [bacterium]|jgi:NADH-quinone oxidoreductase subunit L